MAIANQASSNKFYNLYQQATDPSNIDFTMMENNYQEALSHAKDAKNLTLLTAGIWVLNILDVWLLGPSHSNETASLPIDQSGPSMAINPDGRIMVAYGWRF